MPRVLVLVALAGCPARGVSDPSDPSDPADPIPTDCTPVEHWPDVDGDGHGDTSASPEASCEVPDDRALTADDCNDADPATFPGAVEACDGVPTDCAGTGDDGLVTVGDTTVRDLQEALDLAVDGDEVRVCAGTWLGPFVTAVVVDLVGVGELDRITLDGQELGAVLTLLPGSTVTGVTVTGGRAPVGAGIRLAEAGELTVADSVLLLNEAEQGGGVAVPAGSVLRLPGTTVTLNTAVLGGGIFAGPGATLELTDALVHDNRASEGGGIAGTDLTIVGGVVSGNSAEGSSDYQVTGGGGLSVEGDTSITGTEIAENESHEWGGGGGIRGEDGSLTLTDVVVRDNSADLGGGLFVEQVATTLVGTSVIRANSAYYAGGVYLGGGSFTGGEIVGNTLTDYGNAGGGMYAFSASVSDTVFRENLATSGAGAYLDGSSVRGATFEDNHADISGGGLGIHTRYVGTRIEDTTVVGNTAGLRGGGIDLTPSDSLPTEIVRLTMTDNESPDGGGIFADAYSGGVFTVEDSIVLRNTATEGGAILLTQNARVDVIASDFGTDADDNVPDDVSTEAGPYVGYGADATFQCRPDGCLPTP